MWLSNKRNKLKALTVMGYEFCYVDNLITQLLSSSDGTKHMYYILLMQFLLLPVGHHENILAIYTHRIKPFAGERSMFKYWLNAEKISDLSCCGYAFFTFYQHVSDSLYSQALHLLTGPYSGIVFTEYRKGAVAWKFVS